MAVLSTRAVSGTDDATDLLDGRLPAELTTTTAAPTTVPVTGPAEPAEPAGAPVDPAVAAVCDTNRAALGAAVEAHQLAAGAPPANQQELVADGLLDGPVATHELRPGPNGVEIVGVGGCADR